MLPRTARVRLAALAALLTVAVTTAVLTLGAGTSSQADRNYGDLH